MAEQQIASKPAHVPPSRNTVWVKSKLPWGLDIYPSIGGTDEQSGKGKWVPDLSRRVNLKGTNSSGIVGGHGLTEVDADFWEAWLKQTGKNFEPVRKGLIAAQDTRERAFALAIDEESRETKLEQLDPDRPGPNLEKVPPSELGNRAA